VLAGLPAEADRDSPRHGPDRLHRRTRSYAHPRNAIPQATEVSRARSARILDPLSDIPIARAVGRLPLSGALESALSTDFVRSTTRRSRSVGERARRATGPAAQRSPSSRSPRYSPRLRTATSSSGEPTGPDSPPSARTTPIIRSSPDACVISSVHRLSSRPVRSILVMQEGRLVAQGAAR